jgi:flavorubredoxin
MEKHRVGTDTTVLSDHVEVPGIGFLPVNTFVVHAEQPVVVDTGLSTDDKDFVSELAEVIDPADVRWIWITHPDRDHTGGLWQLLAAAPHARLVTTFIGVGIMSCEWAVPLDRVFLLNPGQRLDVGDRILTGYRPPLFDNPATVGLMDDRTGVFLSSDCFGGPMATPELASAPDVRAVTPEERRAAQLLWAAIDSPWVRQVDAVRFGATVDLFRRLEPTAILSTHLPPAVGINEAMFGVLQEAPGAPEFVGPDQQALEAMLATFEPV